eukprot:624193_1
MDSYRQPPHVAIDGDHVMEIISETYATESDTMNEDNADNDESPCKQYYDACDGHRINVTVLTDPRERNDSALKAKHMERNAKNSDFCQQMEERIWNEWWSYLVDQRID